MAAEHALYATLTDALTTVNAIRKQAAGEGGKYKEMSMDALKQQLGGSIVRKDIGSGLVWCVLKTSLEKILSSERTARFTRSGGFKIVAAPKKGNGKKPSTRLTGEK